MASSVFGRFDAVLVIEARDLDEIARTIYNVIERHPNIVHTETLISFNSGDEATVHRQEG